MSRKPRTKAKQPPAAPARGGRVRIQIQNLGRIKSADIEIAPLTIIAGPNSTGKTYLNYAICSMLGNALDLSKVKYARDSFAGEFVDRKTLLLQRARLEKNIGPEWVSLAHQYLNLSSDKLKLLNADISLGPLPTQARIGPTLLTGGMFSEGKSATMTGDLSEEGLSVQHRPKQIPASLLELVIASATERALLVPVPALVFPITSERTGVALFYRDLDLQKSRSLEALLNSGDVDESARGRLIDILFSKTSRYATPIRDNIDVIRAFEELSKRTSFAMERDGDTLGIIAMLEELSGGNFTVSNGVISFTLKDDPATNTPISATSSAVKSLLLFDIFFRHVATPGSMLVIDEPELNLHPANQRKMARLLVRAVNAGIKVLITTHSDWLIRELSSCIALHTHADDEHLRRTGTEKADRLDPAMVNAYQTTARGILERLPVSSEGIDISSMDDEIFEANRFYEDAREPMDAGT